MNPLIKILRNAVTTLNNLINGLKPDVIRNIKQGFYFLVFILTIVVIVIGYNMGREAARIKRPPLAGKVNEVFEIDVSREKGEKGSLSMQDSKFFIEQYQRAKRPELPYKSAESLKPRGDTGIIDDLTEKRRPKRPALKGNIDILEGDYRPREKKKEEVDILIEGKKKKEPVPKKEPRAEQKKGAVTVIEETRSTKKEVKPIMRDKGIIEP